MGTSGKIVLTIICSCLALVGFMVKLPSGFRHIDKELHALFYFLAAAFLNILFTKKRVLVHILIFAALYYIGIAIEYAQAYSNELLHKRIHGRYDPEDVRANLNGLLLYSALWIVYVVLVSGYNKIRTKALGQK